MNNPKLHRGRTGADAFLSDFLAGGETSDVLLVTDEASYRASGAGDWLERTNGQPFPMFMDFSPNPKEADALRGVALFEKIRARALIAIGGGSAIDMAKLINYFGSKRMGLDAVLAKMPLPHDPLRPLLAVPTTSGTGSEATHFAVIYREHVKYSIADPDIRPSHVLLAPEFTASLPPYQTACTGMDALAQGIESWWAKGAGEESRRYAAEAIRLAKANLETAVMHPDAVSRAAMMEAAHFGGMAINISKTTAPHAFSYILTGEFGLPHGHAVALLLPHFVALHAAAGITVPGVSADEITALLARIGLAKKLPMPAEKLATLLLDNVNLERLSNNPLPISATQIRRMAGELGSGEETE